ncbi:OmpH family outer membrane protein [Flavobacterium sp. Sd200]|uniref:OmpH family outer membrane protein n=1 Tax=Flavobacterium sp. Sd200 TaxID=2692211 RepID=UPI00136B2951|nr:OmpH family outer membrane protein [Flavobacterium sp. Sd200]MXN92654.1 OmpH family outer membrane protein [Flavobacterium sp. Sd200]
MKKSLVILGFAFALLSCNNDKATTASGFKTAYVDTQKLMEKSEEIKDLDDKRKVKTEEMGRELDEKVQQLKLDYASAQGEANAKGPQWAQLKAQELQKRERELGMLQESMAKQLQDEFGVKRDTVVSQIKKVIKEFGKKKGYDYVYGTGDAASILYAKDSYDVTEEILKELNDKFKGSAKAEPAKEDTAKAEEKK